MITRFFLLVCFPLTNTFHRSKAVRTVCEYVQCFDTTIHPDGCINVFERIRTGWGLIQKYRLTGYDIGLGDLEHFYTMGEHALRVAIEKHRPKASGFANDLLQQLEELHVFHARYMQPHESPALHIDDAIAA